MGAKPFQTYVQRVTCRLESKWAMQFKKSTDANALVSVGPILHNQPKDLVCSIYAKLFKPVPKKSYCSTSQVGHASQKIVGC
jgi:hypothetical protein